ncbi:hypothetical protein D3C87_864570 [compost metagenome]
MLAQVFLREALQGAIERAGDLRTGLLQQLLRHLRRRRQLRGQRIALQGRLHALANQLAAAIHAPLFCQRAGTPRDGGRRRVRCAHEAGQDDGVRLVQAGRRLAEQAVRGGRDALQFAAERHEVQIRFKNLRLAPAILDGLRGAHLVPLLAQAASARGRLQVRIELACQLHGDGRGATGFLGKQVIPGGRGQRGHIHAAMLHETLVFRQQHGLLHGRRDIGQRHPWQAPHLHVHAQRLQRRAATVEQLRFRTAIGGLHLGGRQDHLGEDRAGQQAAHQ